MISIDSNDFFMLENYSVVILPMGVGGLAQVVTGGDLCGGGGLDKFEVTKVTKSLMKRSLSKPILS